MQIRRILALVLVTAACAADPAGTDVLADDEAPLSDLDGVVGGAPPNHMLPDDNKADAVYPRTFTELVAGQSPVKSQGSRGVCSIFATAALMEALYIKAGAAEPDFSEQFLQWSVKNEVGAWRNTSGSNAAENLRAISDYGIPGEAAWVYEPRPWAAPEHPECSEGEERDRPVECHTNGDPPEAAMESERHFLPRGRWLNTNSIKAHLTTKKTPVQVGMTFFYQSWNHRLSKLPTNPESWRLGYVLYPNADDVTESLKQRAGHSIIIVGWDDDLEVPVVDKDGKQIERDGKVVTEKGFYLFKNSWGTAGFGIDNEHGPGYGWLSMRYVHEYGSAYVSDLPRVVPPAPGGGDVFELAPGAAIPDRTPAGITSTITVPAGAAVGTVTVTVDISHTYVGDLVLTLSHAGKTVTLQANAGGADDDLRKSFTVSDFAGIARDGAWTLGVSDRAAEDVGTLNRWSIALR
jgi:hypothetical protein